MRSIERERFLADILTTAVEGGINYWSAVSDYQWFSETLGASRPGISRMSDTRVRVHEMNDDGDYASEGVLVTLGTIARGVNLILRGEVPIRQDMVSDIREGSRENDAGYIDADGADCIVQAAILGELRYG